MSNLIVGIDGGFGGTGMVRMLNGTVTDWACLVAADAEKVVNEKAREAELAGRVEILLRLWLEPGTDLYVAVEEPRPEYGLMRKVAGGRGGGGEMFKKAQTTVHLGRLCALFANAGGLAGYRLLQVEPQAGHRAIGVPDGDKERILKMALLRCPALRSPSTSSGRRKQANHHVADAFGVALAAWREVERKRLKQLAAGDSLMAAIIKDLDE